MACFPKVRVVALSSVHYQVPDLDKAAPFLVDFGFVPVQDVPGSADGKSPRKTYYSGHGTQPYVYVAEQSPDGQRRFLGGTWIVAEPGDLEAAAARLPGGQAGIVGNDGPGGGRRVTLHDPNGFRVSFVHGQTPRLRDPSRVNRDLAVQKMRPHPVRVDATASDDAPFEYRHNTALSKPRKGLVRRYRNGPSPVHKLGHYGFAVPRERYKATFEWYTATMNLKPTDSVYDPETGDDITCFLHIDLGKTYTDHHSFFLAASSPANSSQPHVHHASFEVNDYDSQAVGHTWLASRGWTNCWGIGRHVLGSQIFDYWFDPFSNILEHYCDGDLVNEDAPWEREVDTGPGSLYVWGPDFPRAFATGRIEDACGGEKRALSCGRGRENEGTGLMSPAYTCKPDAE